MNKYKKEESGKTLIVTDNGRISYIVQSEPNQAELTAIGDTNDPEYYEQNGFKQIGVD